MVKASLQAQARFEEPDMSALSRRSIRTAAIRSEMRELHVAGGLSLPTLLIGLLAATSAMSAFVTLSSF